MSFSVFELLSGPPSASPSLPSLSSPCPDMSVALFKVGNESNTISTPDASNTPSVNIHGSFEYDLAHGFNLKWSSLSEFEVWHQKEEESKAIELICKELHCNNALNTPKLWNKHHIYICGCGFAGGKSCYQKKHTWTCKDPLKHTGCPCRLTVAFYPGTNIILGPYKDQHSHEIRNQNARFTRLPKKT